MFINSRIIENIKGLFNNCAIIWRVIHVKVRNYNRKLTAHDSMKHWFGFLLRGQSKIVNPLWLAGTGELF